MYYLITILRKSVRYNILAGHFDLANIGLTIFGLILTALFGIFGLVIALYIGIKQIKLSNQQGVTIDEQNRMIKLLTAVSISNALFGDTLVIILNRLTNYILLFRTQDNRHKGRDTMTNEQLKSHSDGVDELLKKVKEADEYILRNQEQIRFYQSEINKINGTHQPQ